MQVSSFLSLKLISLVTMRDFRLTTKPEILNAFLKDFETVKPRFQFSNVVSAAKNDGQVGPDGKGASPSASDAVHSVITSSLILATLVLSLLI